MGHCRDLAFFPESCGSLLRVLNMAWLMCGVVCCCGWGEGNVRGRLARMKTESTVSRLLQESR